MAIKSKLRINQIQDGIADIDASMLPADVQTAAPSLDSEAAGSLEETLIKMMRNDQRRFGSSAKPGFDQTADIGVIAHFSANDAADVRIETQGAAQKIEAIAATNYKMSVDAASDSAELKADDVNLLLDGASSAFTVGVEGQDDGLSIDKANKSAMLVSNANYKVELDSSVGGSEYGEFKVNTSRLKILEAKEALLEVAADSRLMIDDVAKAATLTQGSYELQLDEANTEGHIHIGDVKIDLDNSAAKEINMTTGNSSVKLDEEAQFEVIVDANNSLDMTPGLAEAKAQDSKMILDHAATKARIQTAASFAEVVNNDYFEAQVDANYFVKADKTNSASSLKAAASSLVMNGTGGSEELTLQADTAQKLFLDAGTKARLESGDSILDMAHDGIIDLQTGAGHIIKIDPTTAAEKISITSVGKFLTESSLETEMKVAGNKSFRVYEGSVNAVFDLKMEGSSSASRTDVFGAAAQVGSHVSLLSSGADFERSVKKELVRIADRRDEKIEKGNESTFGSDTSADYQYDVRAGEYNFASLDAGTANSVAFRAAAQKLNGDQHALIAVHGAESAPAAADGAASYMKINQNAIVSKTSGSWTQESAGQMIIESKGLMNIDADGTFSVDATGYGHIQSEGLEFKATGTARATAPANYGVNTMSSLSLSAAGDELWFMDAHKPASWSEGRGVPLTVASEEWEQFEDAYGEVSLIGALVAAGQGGQDSFHHQVDVTAALAVGSDLYADGTITATNIDGSAATTPAVISGSTSLDELKARVEIYVNGQRLQLGATRDFEVSIEDRSGTGGDAREFGLKFSFALEANDVVSVVLK